jgi:dsDNA-binding SOS-regulon protein
MVNEALVDFLVLHVVGNRVNDEPLILSKSPVNIDDEIRTILSSFFITPFKTDKYFNFYHPDGVENNEAFKAVSAIFENPENLYDSSVKLAELLFDITDNSKIKGGEFYAVYFNECSIDGEETEAVGLFKSENKETFLKIYPTSGNFILEKEEGINLRKIDKGCMIFNTEKDKGFLVAVADGIKSGDEKYWCDDFLQIRIFSNSYTQTQSVMKVCKDFVADKLPEEFEVSKADQIDILNRSMTYFKSHDVFDKPEFEQEVLQQPEIIESFRGFDNNLPMDLTFEIAPDAVKKQSKIFKSVLKLDKNFHIYIHGDRSMIERGEEDGKKYYKIFFDKED